jgi:hypothetical protein
MRTVNWHDPLPFPGEIESPRGIMVILVWCVSTRFFDHVIHPRRAIYFLDLLFLAERFS